MFSHCTISLIFLLQCYNRCSTNTEEEKITYQYAGYMAMQALSMKRDGDLNGKIKQDLAALFQVAIQLIQRIWKTAKKQISLGQQVDVSTKRKERCGRKAGDGFLSQISTVPLNRRSSIRSLAAALGVSRSTLHRKFQLEKIRRHPTG